MRNESLFKFQGLVGVGAKEWICEFIFNKGMPIIEEFASTREVEGSNQVRLMQEQ